MPNTAGEPEKRRKISEAKKKTKECEEANAQMQEELKVLKGQAK